MLGAIYVLSLWDEEHSYVNPELGTDKVHAIAHRPRCNLQDG